jgi:hypothetical protein
MDGYFDGTLGSDPVHQDRPHHGLDLSTLDCADLIPKPILKIIPCAVESAARCGDGSEAAGLAGPLALLKSVLRGRKPKKGTCIVSPKIDLDIGSRIHDGRRRVSVISGQDAVACPGRLSKKRPRERASGGVQRDQIHGPRSDRAKRMDRVHSPRRHRKPQKSRHRPP